MAYNITSVKVVKLDATMAARDVCRWIDERGGDLPECCFLRGLYAEAHRVLESGSVPAVVALDGFEWIGGGSGRTMPLLLEVGRAIKGTVDAILTWEGGESHSGLRIRDGVVTQPKVMMTLEED